MNSSTCFLCDIFTAFANLHSDFYEYLIFLKCFMLVRQGWEIPLVQTQVVKANANPSDSLNRSVRSIGKKG